MPVDSIVNLRNDVIFKAVFGYEKNEKILISLLNATLGLEGNDKIVSLTFLNTFNIKEYLKDKLTSLDVKVVDGNSKRYNVEMQVAPDKSYLKRILYYLDKLYTGQLKESEAYEKLSKAISISILNFELLKDEEDLHNIYRYLNVKSKNELTDLKEIHFIELPKFKKVELKDLGSKFEKWIFALKYGEIYDDIDHIPEELKEEEEIAMALREMVKASNDDEIRELLEMREKSRHDEASRMYNALMEAREKAMAEGKSEGEQIGIVKGENKGKTEKAQAYAIRLLTRKFVQIPTNLEKKINDCTDISKLDQIPEIIFDFIDLKDIEKIFE